MEPPFAATPFTSLTSWSVLYSQKGGHRVESARTHPAARKNHAGNRPERRRFSPALPRSRELSA